MNKVLFSFISLALLTCTSCSELAPIRFLPLERECPLPAQGEQITIIRPEVRALFDTNKIAFITADQHLGYYEQIQFAEKPSLSIENLLLNDLRCLGFQTTLQRSTESAKEVYIALTKFYHEADTIPGNFLVEGDITISGEDSRSFICKESLSEYSGPAATEAAERCLQKLTRYLAEKLK